MLEGLGVNLANGDEWLATKLFAMIDKTAKSIPPGDTKTLTRKLSHVLHPDQNTTLGRTDAEKLLAFFNGVVRDPMTKELRVPPLAWIKI